MTPWRETFLAQNLRLCILTHFVAMVGAASSPHVLVVVMDDLGSADLGLHGSGIHTPNLDALARDGTYLTNYYVLPSCSPTRCALLTGRYPIHTGINHFIAHTSNIGLPLEEETLAQLFGKAGYQRHAVGKWHAGHSRWEYTPTFRGFESFTGFYSGGEHYFTHIDQSGAGYDFRRDVREFCGEGCSQVADERGNYSSHVFAREAVKIIEAHDDSKGPLFLYLAFQAVHWPDEVPTHYKDLYASKNWTDVRKIYAGMLTAADEAVGNVTQALKDKGMWDDVLLVFTTDNGGPTQACAVQGSSNYPLRGGKCTVWEGGTAGDGFLGGPMLHRLAIRAGTLPSLFHVVDIFPTLAEIIGAAPGGKELDGVSQLAALRGGHSAREEVYIGWGGELKAGPAIRYKQWKLIKGRAGPGGWLGKDGAELEAPSNDSSYTDAAEWMLFDLSTDMEERHDVAAAHPDVVSELAEKLEGYTRTSVPWPTDDPSCIWSKERLIHTEMGPTWAPWCDGSSTVVVYS